MDVSVTSEWPRDREEAASATETPATVQEPQFKETGPGSTSERAEHPAAHPDGELHTDEVVPAEKHTTDKTNQSHTVYGSLAPREQHIPCCCCSHATAYAPASCAALGLFTILFLLLILIVLPMDIETNFDSFLISDVESSMRQAAFDFARAGRSTGSSRRLQQASSAVAYSTKDLYVAYELKAGGSSSAGILGTKTISQIRQFERKFRTSPELINFCNKVALQYQGLCNPGLSITDYIMPTLNITHPAIVPESLTLDSRGFEAVPIPTAFLIAERQEVSKVILPIGFDPLVDFRTNVVRSAFRFKFEVGTASDTISSRTKRKNEVGDMWQAFFNDVVIPTFSKDDSLESLKETMYVWVDGTGFKDFEVRRAVVSDIPLAIGSACFIYVYMLVHTRSLLLAFFGPVLAVLSVPLTFIVCGVLFETTTVSFANFLAVFLAVGFGADVIFVYTDAWADSITYTESTANRLAWTYRRALKASLATTATTALSFLCNLASVIRALRQFGFFMGLCVLITWLTMTLVYVPLCVVDDKYFSKVRLQLKARTHDEVPLKNRIFGAWTNFLYNFRWLVLVVTVLMLGGFVAGTILNVKMSTGIADIFPENHNQNRGVRVMEDFDDSSSTFSSFFKPPPREVKVCREDDFILPTESCGMYWCDSTPAANPPAAWTGNGTCSCNRKLIANGCAFSTEATAKIRLVGVQALSAQQISGSVAAHMLAADPDGKWQFKDDEAKDNLGSLQKTLPRLILQYWETGVTDIQNLMEISATFQRQSSSYCGFEDVCYCAGDLQCTVKADSGQTKVQLSVEGTSLSTSRRLQAQEPQTFMESSMQGMVETHHGRSLAAVVPGMITTSVPVAKRMKVRAVFGLIAETNIKLLGERLPEDTWSFDPRFDLSDPWAQRALYFFCADIPKDLKIVMMWCFFQDFRNYAREHSGRFPVKAVDWPAASQLYVDTSTSATRGTRYIWLENGIIKAVYNSFELGARKYDLTVKLVALKEAWDNYMEKWALGAPVTAGNLDAFHTSEVWVRVESYQALLSSIAISMLILCLLAFICMMLFTKSVILSLVVVLCTLAVIITLAFFTTTVMKWELGLIEVIASIYFIGYALDYSLHIVYKYASNEAMTHEEAPANMKHQGASNRVRRTTFAMKTMGTATLGSAITTAGSSLFLVFCTLTIFVKLGAMCFIVTFASILFAMIPLGSGLTIFGPRNPGKCRMLEPFMPDLSECRRAYGFSSDKSDADALLAGQG